jgi:putative transport protein
VLLAIALVQRVWKVDYQAEARRTSEPGSGNEPLETRVVKVLRAHEELLGALMQRHRWDVVFGRHQWGEEVDIADLSTQLAPGTRPQAAGHPNERAHGPADPTRSARPRSSRSIATPTEIASNTTVVL